VAAFSVGSHRVRTIAWEPSQKKSDPRILQESRPFETTALPNPQRKKLPENRKLAIAAVQIKSG
jgi:hypothetical protein